MPGRVLTQTESLLHQLDVQRRQLKADEKLLREMADLLHVSRLTRSGLDHTEVTELWIGVADHLALCHECGEDRDPEGDGYCPSCAISFDRSRAEDARLERAR